STGSCANADSVITLLGVPVAGARPYDLTFNELFECWRDSLARVKRQPQTRRSDPVRPGGEGARPRPSPGAARAARPRAVQRRDPGRTGRPAARQRLATPAAPAPGGAGDGAARRQAHPVSAFGRGSRDPDRRAAPGGRAPPG